MTSCACKSPWPQKALLLTGVASVTIDVRWRISRSECGMQEPPFAFAGAGKAAGTSPPPVTQARRWLIAVRTVFMFSPVNEEHLLKQNGELGSPQWQTPDVRAFRGPNDV